MVVELLVSQAVPSMVLLVGGSLERGGSPECGVGCGVACELPSASMWCSLCGVSWRQDSAEAVPQRGVDCL